MIIVAAALIANAAGGAYIVGMYSIKERRGIGGYFLMKVDGKKVAKLRYPTYYRLEVPPGVYTVTFDDKAEPPILCHLIAGESCYIRALLTGNNGRDVALISPQEAAKQLQQLLPLEREHVYLETWK